MSIPARDRFLGGLLGGGIGNITDDTQMTLFTAKGLLRARVRDLDRGVTT
jgi:ADP-ribosylglycohydrolase